ncbi:MAG: hypothetical protein JKY37_23080, partial [Nannocystaceae bacterium]|nr:hypothetical protein [Nannocystaceae bacterium]
MLLATMIAAWCLAPSAAGVSDDPVPALALQWDAPASCPDETAVREAVASYLDNAVPHRELSAVAKIQRRQAQWVLQLRFDGLDRQVEAASCEDLVDATAAILSL